MLEEELLSFDADFICLQVGEICISSELFPLVAFLQAGLPGFCPPPEYSSCNFVLIRSSVHGGSGMLRARKEAGQAKN